MRKILITLLAALISVAAQAQKVSILYDRPEADGSRQVSTDYVSCRNGMGDKLPLEVALACTVLPSGEEMWDLRICISSATSFAIPKGSRMLIRLGNGDLIELTQTLDDHLTQDRVGTYSELTHIKTYEMHAVYSIDEEDVRRIASGPVVKVRVEKQGEPGDNNYRKDRIGEAVAAEYALIKQTLGIL